MTDAEDNDTSVIRGRAIMKARGWDSHENRSAACRLMTSQAEMLTPGGSRTNRVIGTQTKKFLRLCSCT